MPSSFVHKSLLICASLTVSTLLGCATFDERKATFQSVPQSNNVAPRPEAKPASELRTAQAGSFGAVLGGIAGKSEGDTASAAVTSDRKLVRTATLTLSTTDVDALLEKIRALANRSGGYIEESKLADEGRGEPAAIVKLRIPASLLEDATGQLKKLALRVRDESIQTEDVTRRYVDLDARIRNLQAEEQQYLAILKRASTVKDALQVTPHVSDVRGQIEEAQGEMKYLSHQIEMALISVTLRTELPAKGPAPVKWSPSATASHALHDLLEGLADWADAILSLLIALPLVLLWIVTLSLPVALLWKPTKYLWVRLHKAQPVPQPTQGD
jgi:hypothetical protein